jgi:hypothetical protein
MGIGNATADPHHRGPAWMQFRAEENGFDEVHAGQLTSIWLKWLSH